MTTYKGEYLEPQEATFEQSDLINDILEIDDKLKNLVEARNELISKLPQKTPMVFEAEESHRTIIVDVPTGHYVTYRPFDFSMNAKTTKADLKEITTV